MNVLLRQLFPFGFARQSKRTIRRTFGSDVTARDMPGSLAAIRPHELRWNPNQIPQVRGFGQCNPLDAAKRHP